MTTTISVHEAEHDLAALLKRARAGEEIVIAMATRQAYGSRPYPQKSHRIGGAGF